jgi:hypothetical protein
MDEFEAGAAGFTASAVAGDAMADAIEAPELLDVDVQEFAGMARS